MPSTKTKTRRVRVHLRAVIDFDVESWGEEGQTRLRGAVMDRIARMGHYVNRNGFERFLVAVYTINLDTEVVAKPHKSRSPLRTGKNLHAKNNNKG